MININLSNGTIAKIKYDPKTEVLAVVYRGQKGIYTYEYLDVPKEALIAMTGNSGKEGFSYGRWLAQHIKKKYKYRKID